MAEIPLTRGKVALIDDEDLPLVSGLKWQCFVGSDGHHYAVSNRQIPGKGVRAIRMHRLIAGTPDGMVTDHINGDGLDNRRANLRICTEAQNHANRRTNNASGFRGVFEKRGGFEVHIYVEGRTRYFGRYKTAVEAARVYDAKVTELRGGFALTNKAQGRL